MYLYLLIKEQYGFSKGELYLTHDVMFLRNTNLPSVNETMSIFSLKYCWYKNIAGQNITNETKGQMN